MDVKDNKSRHNWLKRTYDEGNSIQDYRELLSTISSKTSMKPFKTKEVS